MTGDTLLRYNGEHLKMKGRYTMTDAERARKQEKTVMISMRLQKSTDADILAFLEGRGKQTAIKAALHYYITHEKEVDAHEAEYAVRRGTVEQEDNTT